MLAHIRASTNLRDRIARRKKSSIVNFPCELTACPRGHLYQQTGDSTPTNPLTILDMSAVDYLLHESSVGYAIFQVAHQADTIGNRLKEVQDAAQDLAKFGKMVKLVNFAPYRYDNS